MRHHITGEPCARPGALSISRRAVLALGLAAAALTVQAQTYPDRPIKLIVPFSPGGTTDVIGRLVATALGEEIGQTVVVDNKGGAGSILGTDLGAKAPPNGYTLVITNGAAITTGPLLGQKVPYDPYKDFTHIMLLGTFPNGVIVRTSHPAKDFKEFVELARQAGGKYNYGSAGVGSAGFLAGEMLKQKAHIDMTHVPYKGTGPAMNDLIGGQLDAIFNNMAVASAQARAGNVRILAVSGPKRVPAFPDVPTMSETIPGMVGEAWFGVSAPAGTPAAVVDKLEAALAKVMSNAEFRAKLAEQGLTPVGAPQAEFVKFLHEEERKWAPIIKAANIKLE
ncbi:MAG: tripartite tricarboxylate transporter substrate binding protein [Pigmentiphaga sp.]|uniref:Bug family tripartite tricarboxylate transporter substrate binding protein n=1 Tax=Pigmentiphaga sp. TaxID=1977564 RepID=UPI0029BE23C0|nr:tripartite tricarboxylate transporter substrate binding protein [Pigmentiphaga sp.]MDX3905857.1 tripartite tricarboxylate transporter substrate binding protein [Pigmentiphaga sp.]